MPRRSPQTQERVDLPPGRPSLAKSGELPRSAAAELGLRRRPAAARAPKSPEPPDIGWTAEIRTAPPLILATRSGSDGPDLNVPLRPAHFAKDPPGF